VNSAKDSPKPNAWGFSRAFEALVSTLTQRQIRYAIIGGVAVLQHTRVRTTDDINVLLSIPQIALPGLLEALRERGFEVDLERNIREFRDDGLTVLKYQEVIIDLMRPLLPAYAHVLDRAIRANVLGQEVMVSSAEGLIVMKLIAMRPQDEADVQDLLESYGGKLDVDFIRAELDTFAGPGDPRWASSRNGCDGRLMMRGRKGPSFAVLVGPHPLHASFTTSAPDRRASSASNPSLRPKAPSRSRQRKEAARPKLVRA
jgi:predicted nucleotidyltransferase